MWLSWAVIGLLQIYTNRYWAKNWRWNKKVHAILGFASMALVVTAGFIALKTGGWTINSSSSLHAKSGFCIFIMGLTLMLGGIIAANLRLFAPLPWNTKWILRVGMVHRWFGWGVILTSQFVIGAGFVNFYVYNGQDTLAWSMAGGSAALFFTFLAVGEIRHQLILRKEVPFAVPQDSMSAQEFTSAIDNGRKYVILDDLVLDVEKFIDQHPGGRFVLQHNIGRDVSKFFYGGYSLEDNMGPKPAKGYAHSAIARMIVNDLAIARYKPDETVASTVCRVREDLSVEVNPRTKVIVLENIDEGVKVPNFKTFYKDLEFLTKHFLIRSLDGSNSVARHYTICNAMRPDIYDAYVRGLKPESDPEHVLLERRRLTSED